MLDKVSLATHSVGGGGPLEGVTILDLGHMLAAPYATMLLADLGANVIKIESPTGDFIRSAGPFFGDPGEQYGGYFHSVNRNKRSISLNLQSDGGREVFLDLVKSADALIENFRLSVMDKLGLGYSTLRKINPRLVYGCIRGFGDPATGKSPYAEWPAYDIVAQAMSGFMAVTGEADGPPMKAGPGIGDIFPASLLATGVLAALRHAERTGEGQLVDVSLYDAMLSLCERSVYQESISGVPPVRQGNAHPFLAPFGVFKTLDGWVALAAPTDPEWRTLTDLMGQPELAENPDFASTSTRGENRERTHHVVAVWCEARTTAEVMELVGGRIPAGPVQDMADIVDDPHVEARQMIVEVPHPGTDRTVRIAGTPIKFDRSPVGVRTRAPLLGENTDEILRSIGYDDARISRLREDGIAK